MKALASAAAARADDSIDLPAYDRDPIGFVLGFADGTVSGSFDTTAPLPL